MVAALTLLPMMADVATVIATSVDFMVILDGALAERVLSTASYKNKIGERRRRNGKCGRVSNID